MTADRNCGRCWKCLKGQEVMHMVICPKCGNKRCPHASDHTLPCTRSNASGQPGSIYGPAPSPAPSPGPQDVREKIARELFGFIADQGITLDGELRDAILPVIIDALRRAALAQSAGHTDLMVRPETLDAFMEANPLPASPQDVREGAWVEPDENEEGAQQEPFAWAYRRRGFEGWNLMSSKPEFGDQYENMPLYITPPALPEGAREASEAERQAIATEARRYASHYPQSSDGRNTFILLAEWIESRARAADRSAT